MRNAPKKPVQFITPEAITTEIERLAGLPLKALKAAWAAEFRREPPKGMWRDLLLRTLAWRLQEKAFGGHDKATMRLLEAYGQKRTGDQRCQRLKAGTVLVREFGGSRHTVTIVPEGFVWQEKTCSSLSVVARSSGTAGTSRKPVVGATWQWLPLEDSNSNLQFPVCLEIEVRISVGPKNGVSTLQGEAVPEIGDANPETADQKAADLLQKFPAFSL